MRPWWVPKQLADKVANIGRLKQVKQLNKTLTLTTGQKGNYQLMLAGIAIS